MQAESFQTAYQPFADTLRAGGFKDPDHGWGAAQIAAHIALSNEQFSELADQVRAGQVPEFDNTQTWAAEALTAYAAKFDGLAGLADAVLSSGARAAEAYAALSDEQRAVKLPTTIWHEGQIVQDEPAAIGDLLAGNADFHLDMHLAQLRALRPE